MKMLDYANVLGTEDKESVHCYFESVHYIVPSWFGNADNDIDVR